MMIYLSEYWPIIQGLILSALAIWTVVSIRLWLDYWQKNNNSHSKFVETFILGLPVSLLILVGFLLAALFDYRDFK